MSIRAEDKAKELFQKYLTLNLISPLYGQLSYSDAKQCALIAVDEIIEELIELEELVSDEIKLPFRYWQNVKIKISLL